MKKGGIFGFLAGAGLGGLVALLSAKRKGRDLRNDLMASWKEGKTGGGVLKEELAGVAKEAKEGMTELYNTKEVQKIAKEAKAKLGEAKATIEKGYADVAGKAKKAADEFVGGMKDAMGDEKKVAQTAVKKAKKTVSRAKKTVKKAK